jgi:hypothetical protein
MMENRDVVDAVWTLLEALGIKATVQELPECGTMMFIPSHNEPPKRRGPDRKPRKKPRQADPAKEDQHTPDAPTVG